MTLVYYYYFSLLLLFYLIIANFYNISLGIKRVELMHIDAQIDVEKDRASLINFVYVLITYIFLFYFSIYFSVIILFYSLFHFILIYEQFISFQFPFLL